MKLTFITGKAGSGKTSCLFENFSKDEDNFMITTDSSVFYIESLMSKLKYPGKCVGINSFINYVLQENGGITEEIISEDMQVVFLTDIMIKNFKNLKVLKVISYDNNLVDSISNFINECISENLSPENLEKFGEDLFVLSKNKVKDISLIYREYLDFLADKNFINKALLAKKVLKMLNTTKQIKFKKVFVDSLNSYDSTTMEIIKTLINICDEVYIAFSTITPVSFAYEIYKESVDAYKKIDSYAIESGCVIYRKTLKPLNEKHTGMQIIEDELFNKDTETESDFHDVFLHEASTLYKEIDFITSKIKELIDSGYSFDDIIITGTDIPSYRNIIANSFNKNKINSYYYKNKNFNSTKLYRFFYLMELAANEGLSADIIKELLDINYFNIDEADKTIINIFFNRFGNDIDVALKNCEIYDKDNFLKINVILNKIQEEISDFINRIISCEKTVDFCKAYYEYAEKLKISDRFFKQYEALSEEPQIANEILETWNGFVSLIDNLEKMDKNIDFDQFIDIFNKMAEEIKLINTQEYCNEIKILDLFQAQNRKSKICFVIGCNEGKFPFDIQENLFSDKELISLNEKMHTNFITTVNTMNKNYSAIFSVLTLPSEKLFISWASHDTEARNMRAANILNNILKIFKKDMINEEKFYGNDKEEVFLDLLSNLGEYRKTGKIQGGMDDEYWEMSSNPVYSERLSKAIHNAIIDKSKFNMEYPEKCYKENEFFGVTRIERFAQCPFKHFVEFGLMPKYQKVFEETAANKGNFYHEVLNQFFALAVKGIIDINTIGKNEFNDIINEIIEKVSLNHNENILDSNLSLRVEKQKMKRKIKQTVWQNVLQIRAGKFSVFKTEFKIGRDIPLKLTLPDGNKVNIIGVVDRIDTADINNKKFVRIIDYKSGSASFSEDKVLLGLQLQLPLYMKAIVGDYNVAGIYYSKITEAIKDADTDELPEKKFQLNGISINDRAILTAQDSTLISEPSSSKVIQADITTKGEISKKSKVMSGKEFEDFIDNAVEVAEKIIKEILDGETSANPKKLSDFNSCEYCQYKSLCHKR